MGNPQGAGERDGGLMPPCPKDGDVILTRRLLEVRGVIGKGLENPMDGQIYLQNAQIYGSAHAERIKFECSLRSVPRRALAIFAPRRTLGIFDPEDHRVCENKSSSNPPSAIFIINFE